jgi:imidazole glycerol-phosphate synthase subunit HisH
MIGIVDYGAGNLASVANALDRLGHEAAVLAAPAALESVSAVILPGVGSFKKAMAMLDSGGWPSPLRAFAAGGRPFLGICLGMQLLFDRGAEHGITEGLGLIAGDVRRLEPSGGAKVPQVGWNALIPSRPHPLLAGVNPRVDFYFVHSYHCVPASEDDILTRSDYGGMFVSGVAHGNVAGFQFHPEKSQPMGLKILDNFASWDGTC